VLDSSSRRSWLKFASFAFPAGGLSFGTLPLFFESKGADTPAPANAEPVPDFFPTQPPELVREMVTVSHFNLKRVQELVEARISLARAAWDWGFGDWEDALGAASHMGNRPIAEYLLSKGARPTLFSAAMLGQLEVVKAFIAAQPGAQRIRGPHSISLLAHAKAGGAPARPVFEFLQSLGDADSDPLIPLADAEAETVKGTYVFGPGASQRIEVSVDKSQVTWTREGTMGRPLLHLGNRVFYPLGAPSVRIRFTTENSATIMTVSDPDVILTLLRKSL